MSEHIPAEAAKLPNRAIAATAALVVPAIIADAGETATRRFLEFFAATIRNKNNAHGLLPGRQALFRLV